MRLVPHSLVTALGVAGLLISCGPPTDNPDAGSGIDQVCANDREPCQNDRDCVGGVCDKGNDGDELAAADDPFGCCVVLVCTRDADCVDPDTEKCDLRRGICVPRNLCDPANPEACTGAGQKCMYVDGAPQCAVPPAAASCSLSPSPGYVVAGETIEITGTGFNDDGKLNPHTSFTFAAPGATFAGNVMTAPATTGNVTVTGTAEGGATCTTTVSVREAIAATDARVTLIDLATRQPISGAPVAVKKNGAFLATVNTDADGEAIVTGGGSADLISVFPANYQWHTIVAPTTSDVILFTAAVPPTNPPVDGVTGSFDFSKVHSNGDIRLGLGGMAISAAITDLNFNAIIGETVDTEVYIDGITQPGDTFPLPEGLVIGLGDEDFKPNYVALSDRAGPSTVWALGGQVALGKVGPIISSVAGADDINAGAILGAVLPFFATFDHAIESGLTMGPLAARTGTSTTGFDTRDVQPNTLLSQSAKFTMPDLPCAPLGFGGASRCGQALFELDNGDTKTVVTTCPSPLPAGATCDPVSSFTSGVVVLSGVLVPGQGLVPLGISAGLDDEDSEDGDDFDGKVDQENVPTGSLIIDYAPPHDGVEGNYYVTVAIALDINSIASSDAAGFGASIITNVSRRLADAEAATPNTFAGAFLESQGGTFTSGATGSFTLTKKGTGANFYRVNLDDGGDAEWNVWFEGSGNNAGFNVADLHPAAIDVAARTQHADVQAFRLGTGYDGASPANFDDLFGFDGKDLDNLLLYLGGWSSEACKAGGLCSSN